ncbi:hypothetical protein LCGC14_1582050, partial [marine sediment metagenome]
MKVITHEILKEYVLEKIPASKKVVYIIGPFRAATDYERMLNIRLAQD